MRGVFTIAKFSLTEIVRGKVFKILLIIPIIMLIITCGYGYWGLTTNQFEQSVRYTSTFQNQQYDLQSVQDQLVRTYLGTILSVFIIYPIYIFFGNFLVIFNSVGLMSPELERRSIYTLISKPLSRPMIYAGKFIGILLSQVIFSVVLLVITQTLLIISGAGYYPNLLPSFAIGFLNFILFGGIALLISSWFKSISASVLSLVVLVSSSNGGMTMAELIGKQVFKFGKWVDYALYALPQQRNIGRLANSFNLDKYQKMFIDDFPSEFNDFEFLKLITDDPSVLIQPGIWLGVVIIGGFYLFSKKEFD